MIPTTSSTMAEGEERETSFFDRRHGDVVIEAVRRQRRSAESFCDVLLNVRGRTIGVHAAVLAAVSPYFAELFGSDLPRVYSQRCPQTIDIVADGGVDADGLADAVEAIVEFIYSGYLRVNQSILARVTEIAGIMRLESAVHFCEEIISGKLYSSQLVIKDGKLTEKADANIGTVDDTLTSDSKPLTMMPEIPKIVLSASQIAQTRVNRPPTMLSVGTQVYPSLLDNAAAALDQKSDEVGLGQQHPGRLPSNRNKSSLQVVSDSITDLGASTQHLPHGGSRSRRQSQRVRRKPVKLTHTDETCPKSTKHSSCKRICPDIQLAVDDTQYATSKSSGMAKIAGFDRSGLEETEVDKPAGDRFVAGESSDYGGGKFRCSLCGFSTNNVRKISAHNRDHQQSNNICYYCERRFASSGELSLHVEAEHSDRQAAGGLPFLCILCPSRFRTRTQLVAHLPKHSSTRPFICARCGASFKWRSTLHEHAATHTARKEHLCDVCGYATAHRGQLRSHRLVHTPGGTMRCHWPDCDFRATRRQNLKYHLLTHTQEKPHQCHICGQSFSLAKNLKRHILSHVITAAKHSCSRCAFSTLRYDKLKEHLHKQHKVGTAPERRVRITDLVNLDLAKTLEGSAGEPVPQSTQLQSLDVPDAAAVGPSSTISCVVDFDMTGGNTTCPDKQQTVVGDTVTVVEPADFLLGSVQPLNVLTVSGLAPDDVSMSSVGPTVFHDKE